MKGKRWEWRCGGEEVGEAMKENGRIEERAGGFENIYPLLPNEESVCKTSWKKEM